MNPDESRSELLLRYIDGRGTSDERQAVADWLRSDPAARAFLREVAEQAVLVADIERTAQGRQQELWRHTDGDAQGVTRVRFRRWQWMAAAAAAVTALLAIASLQFFQMRRLEIARVSKITGATQLFGAGGNVENALQVGAELLAGDTLETRSIDAWIELELRDGSKLTVAGHSALRILEQESGMLRLRLLSGSLWISPAEPASATSLIVRTPSAMVETRSAQFDLHACSTETTVRVNQGSGRMKRMIDGSEVKLSTGDQATASLGQREPLTASPQPKPVNFWASELDQFPEVTLGHWLPPNATASIRLGAEPLLWPIPNRDPLLLHVAALSVRRSSDRPVVLQPGAQLIFRGRTERPQKVRFGFSTQKMKGAFAGKFEMDVDPQTLGAAGQPWTVTLPISSFRPMQPDLSASPEGLELGDVYALTILEDAGLELSRIELVPEPAQQKISSPALHE